MTARIREFLNKRRESGVDEGPVLVVDLDVIRTNYQNFAKALPDSRVFYAVKANPAPEVLSLLASLGSCFDTASVPEIEMALAAGATADRISYGNTIKKERDIARAYALGVRLFAVDCKAEVEKIARSAAGSQRVLPHPVGLRRSRVATVAQVRLRALHGRGRAGARPQARARRPRHLVPRRVPADQPARLGSGAGVGCRRVPGVRRSRHQPAMVNLGGGFPTKYTKNVPTVKAYGSAIFSALRKHFGNRIPETIIEPGRGMVGNAGIIEAEVVLVSTKSNEDEVRWVYLDLGKFGGLAETMDESIRYPIRTPRDGDATAPCVAGRPDLRLGRRAVREEPYELPVSLEIGDKVLIEGTGAYTTTYAAVGIQRLRSAEGLSHLKTAPAVTCLPRSRGRQKLHRRPTAAVLFMRKTPMRSIGYASSPTLPHAGKGQGKLGECHEPNPSGESVRRRRPRGAARRGLRTGPLHQAVRSACAPAASPRAGCRSSRSRTAASIGTVRLWEVAAGADRAALLLGPLAVHPDCRSAASAAR